jgi:ComF family protein
MIKKFNILIPIWNYIKTLFYKYFLNNCIYCNNEIYNKYDPYSLCECCYENLYFYKGCYSCPLQGCCCLIKTAVPFYYKGLITELIISFKYANKINLKHFFVNEILKILNYEKNFLLIYVPTSYLRMLKRGYNQAFILAEEISTRTQLKLLNNILVKKRYSHSINADKENRVLNANAIELNLKNLHKIKNQHIILVDDVIASGATINRCINLLEEHVLSITVVAIARR